MGSVNCGLPQPPALPQRYQVREADIATTDSLNLFASSESILMAHVMLVHGASLVYLLLAPHSRIVDQ